MNNGLSHDELARIRAILETVPSVDKAVLFGSRATGLARGGSDIDIMLYGDGLKISDIMQISSLLEDTTLPYQFDLIRYDVENLDLLEHVKQYGRVIFQRDKTSSERTNSKRKMMRLENNMKNCPKVPLPELLSFVVDNRGKTVPTAENGHILIATNCIKNEFLYPVFEKIRYLSGETYKTWFRAHPLPGDVIFVNKGTPGRVCMVPEPVNFCIAQDMIAFRVDEQKLYNKYLLAVLRDPEMQAKINNYNVGDVIPHFKKSFLDELLIPLPSIEIQQEIGDIYFDISAKIDNNIKINHHLEQMAQAIFKSWFVDFEPWGGEMPEDWQAVTLGELCNVVTKGTTPTTLKKQFVSQGINFVKAESILDDHSLDFGKLAFIDEETNALLSRSVIHKNDIIFTIAGTLGRFAFACADLLPANANQAVAIIRTDASKIKPVTLYSFFIGGLHSDFYTKNIQQAVQANLSLTTIKALPLLLPPTETLSEYSADVEPLLEQIFQHDAENRKLAEMRDALLPRLMSGELSVAGLGGGK